MGRSGTEKPNRDRDDRARLSGLARDELDKVLSSTNFNISDRNRKFLRFVVEETLAGRERLIKGYSVALSVFGRDADFDPQADPVVRIEAGRVRRALERYYLTDGRSDHLRITIPKGSYVPNFDIFEVDAAVVRTARVSDQALANLAITPIVDLSGNEDGSQFCNGLTEDIVASLSRYHPTLQLFGTSRQSMSILGSAVPSGKHRLQLNGSMRFSERRLRVIVHIVDQIDGRYVWSRIFDRTGSDLRSLRLQAELGKKIAASLIFSDFLAHPPESESPRDEFEEPEAIEQARQPARR